MPQAAPTTVSDWLVIARDGDQADRPDRSLTGALAQRHPRARFVIAEAPLRLRDVRRWRIPHAAQVAPNIWTVRSIRPLPGTSLARVNDHLECMQLRRAARSLGIESALLWTRDPRAADLMDELPVEQVVFDRTDDRSLLEADTIQGAHEQERVERLLARAELVGAEAQERALARRAAAPHDSWESRACEIESALGLMAGQAREHGVCAVIVSHNTRNLLERCLIDLHAQTGGDLRTIVVDNASSDGSAELVRRHFPGAKLIELDQNAGFGRANNLALGHCRTEYVLLLNSDAFLAPGALAALVAAAERHPRAGAVGPRLSNPDGTLQRSAWPFPHAGRLLLEAFALHRPLRRLGLLEDLGTWDHQEERSVDFLVGACLLLRADALAEVGGFDEEFWLYGEEADLQRRITTRGWEVVFTPRASAVHVGGASSQGSLTRQRHLWAGQRRYLAKHGSLLGPPSARLALLMGSALRGRLTGIRAALGL